MRTLWIGVWSWIWPKTFMIFFNEWHWTSSSWKLRANHAFTWLYILYLLNPWPTTITSYGAKGLWIVLLFRKEESWALGLLFTFWQLNYIFFSCCITLPSSGDVLVLQTAFTIMLMGKDLDCLLLGNFDGTLCKKHISEGCFWYSGLVQKVLTVTIS